MHYLYRHFDVKGILLYVGISHHAVLRTAAHKNNSMWFPEIARIEITNYPSKEDAARAERAAIIEEKPIHNKKSGPRKTNRKGGDFKFNERMHEQASPRAQRIIALRKAGAEWLVIAGQFRISPSRAQQLYDAHVGDAPAK